MPLAFAPPSLGIGAGETDRIVFGTGTSVPPGVDSVLEFNGLLMNNRKWIDTFLITEIDGLGDADIRDDREANPQAHGETFYDAFYGGRTIVLNGKIRCFTLNKLRDMEQALRASFADLSTERDLIFHTQNPATDAVIRCKKAAPLAIKEVQTQLNEFSRDFMLTLRASNPRFFSRISEIESAPFGFIDTFSTDSIGAGLYDFPVGSGTIAVSGGEAVPSSTARKRMLRNDISELSNSEVVVKYKKHSTSVSNIVGAIQRWKDDNNFLVTGILSDDTLYVAKMDGGVRTDLHIGAPATPARTNGTYYWIRTRIVGNTITVDHSTTDPRIDESGITTTYSYILTGGDVASFGTGVSGMTGVVFEPGNTSWRIDDVSVSPYQTTGYYALTARNKGNFSAQPQITINGPVTDVVLLNNSTGEVMSFTGTIPEGDSLKIDIGNRTIVNDAGDNKFSMLSVDSDWIGLAPGDNDIYVSAADASPEFTSAWMVPGLSLIWKHAWI